MLIKWKGQAQHLDRITITAGDTIDTAEFGIPDEAAKVWVRDGDAEEVKKPRAAKKADAEE